MYKKMATARKQRCVRFARECSRNSWQLPIQHRSEYKRMSREAMQDARYWRDREGIE